MPIVNGKKYPYTAAGKAAAKKAAASPKPKPKPTMTKKATPKPKATPKFTAPSVAEFRKSAAYKTDSMGYKEYVDTAYEVYQYKYGKKK